MRIRVGELRERITIKRRTETANDSGTLVAVESTVARLWAHVRPRSGSEQERAGRLEPRAQYMVVIRRRTGISEDDWIEWQGYRMNIRAILDPGPRGQFMELVAERGAP